MLCVVGIHYGNANTPRVRVQQIYTSQIGVKEATGRNDGPQVEAYLKVTGLGAGYPWCAAFVAWCFKNANISAINSAYSPAWFQKSKLVTVPKQGDLFGLYFKHLKRIAHVGFVDADAGAFIITVEGNTNGSGSREGNEVAKRRRLKKQIHKYANWID